MEGLKENERTRPRRNEGRKERRELSYDERKEGRKITKKKKEKRQN